MVIVAAIALVALLIAFPLLLAAIRRLRRLKLVRGTLFFGAGALVVFVAIAAAFVTLNLFTYARLTREQHAARVSTRELAERRYVVTVQVPKEEARHFEVRGDEWQIDARVLKWRAFATLVGFDTAYRLERLSGRYGDIALERTAPRTVHALAPESGLDLWALIRRHHRYLPLADALYGSAAYVPMAEGAEYDVTVSASGLVVRPANDAARKAVGGWK
jgi:membrane protein implicated in regulation of membrane protease activity